MQCLSKLESARRPETAWLEPMEMLAAAWISAATGAVTRAGEARSAAVTAASRGQPARGALPADCDEIRGHDDGDAAR